MDMSGNVLACRLAGEPGRQLIPWRGRLRLRVPLPRPPRRPQLIPGLFALPDIFNSFLLYYFPFIPLWPIFLVSSRIIGK
jgi:hypothetical protein